MAQAGDEIENPLTGERIVFRLTAGESSGRLLELDDFWTRSGHRATRHIHPEMEERWELLSGVAHFQIGEQLTTATAGDVVVAPAGTPHRAWNPGDEPVHLRIQMRPALRWEEFIERLFAMAGDTLTRADEAASRARLDALLVEFSKEVTLI